MFLEMLISADIAARSGFFVRYRVCARFGRYVMATRIPPHNATAVATVITSTVATTRADHGDPDTPVNVPLRNHGACAPI